jgi:GT2 family glycosyltransferase
LTADGHGEPVASLVVVNFNGAGSVRACIESLITDESSSIQVLVVDNASTDSSPAILDALADTYPVVEILPSQSNRGYAGAVNLALPSCRGRYVGVLNMDVIAEPGWLAPLVSFLDNHENVGAVCPLIALAGGDVINATGQDLHVSGLGFNKNLGRPRTSAGSDPIRCGGLHGATFLIRRDLLVALGGMDESGFLYQEDVNLSWMLRLARHDIYCLPGSVVRHDYYLSMHPTKLYLLERNRWSLILTALRAETLALLLPALLVTEVMVWGYAVLRGPGFLAAKARTYAALWSQRKARRIRREEIARLRVLGDLELLGQLTWRYPWRQFFGLALERGEPRRPFSAT